MALFGEFAFANVTRMEEAKKSVQIEIEFVNNGTTSRATITTLDKQRAMLESSDSKNQKFELSILPRILKEKGSNDEAIELLLKANADSTNKQPRMLNSSATLKSGTTATFTNQTEPGGAETFRISAKATVL